MTVEHTLSCKKGGLVHTRHDVVADEWRNLCRTGFAFGRVGREPLIFLSANSTQHETTNGREGGGKREDRREEIEGEGRDEDKEDEEGTSNIRGDASCFGFWQRGRDTIFDKRITDTDAQSHQNIDPIKVLELQEKEKKAKYLAHLHEQRKDFTPMVYSLDGIAGKETKRAEK